MNDHIVRLEIAMIDWLTARGQGLEWLTGMSEVLDRLGRGDLCTYFAHLLDSVLQITTLNEFHDEDRDVFTTPTFDDSVVEMLWNTWMPDLLQQSSFIGDLHVG